MHGAAVVRFTHELSRWEPETFVRTVLVDWLRVAEVWVGANFLFGHDRAGNFSLLRALGARYGFRAEKIDPCATRTSSSAAPASAGWSARGASTRLARCSGISTASTARSSHGDTRGRELGFPTANLRPTTS